MSEPDFYQLSPLQQGMLFEYLKDPQEGMDLVQIICETGELFDRVNFELAWRRVMGRHEILRTGFVWRDVDEPRQEVKPDAEMPFEWHEGYYWLLRKREEQWAEYLRRDRSLGFDLEKAPLMRMAMFRVGWRRWRMCWTFHHLLLDGRGVLQVLNEVFAFYEALERREELSLPVAPPFRDYIEWHQRADWSAAEKYWRERLRGFHAPTSLPILNSLMSAVRRQDAWAEELTELAPAVTDTLKTLALNVGVTLNTVLQGAWALLLSRYSGEKDVVFGAIRACRKSNIQDAGKTVGLFVNTLPMRVDVRSEASIADWLREVREQWMSMRDFENTPLVSVQRWSELPRGGQLFDTIFNFQEPSWDIALTSQGRDWSKRQFSLRNQPSYPLTADIYGGGKSLILKLNYDPRRFDKTSIVRMLGHFERLLTNMAGDPAARLSQIEMLRPEEKRKILVDWNQTATDFPRQRCIHELFEEQVKRVPGVIAVVYGKTQLTYQKLEYRANRIANFLRSRGVGRGTRVGICLERSVEMVAAMLGILKAGGAYVPLDPEYPKDRLAFMLRDVQAPMLLTSERLRESLPETSAEIVCLDGDWASIREHSSDPVPSGGTSADDLAYVIYTSGSTGIPKGVCVPHRGVVRLVRDTNYIHLRSDDRVAQAANASFDAATFEIWGGLLNGARVVGVSKDTLLSPEELGRQIREQGITTLFLTTALFNQVAREEPDAFVSLRHLLFGGEAVDPACVRIVLEKGAPRHLLHVYGPTETTTFATWFPVAEVAGDATTVPIGRPISNTEAYVLGPDGKPVPVGVSGELYLGGDGVASGYLHRPELTAEKFVVDPFSGKSGARLYRTGDLVRWTADGNIEFLGRIDHQVKVRGFRIELGEIEAVLLQHPMVSEAAVILREDTPGDKRLAAYVVPRTGMDIRHPRSFLSERLPNYMVPSILMVLQALPLSPNGKVDRRALPKPDRGEADNDVVTPRTAVEETVAGIWGDILGLAFVSIHDNFFEQGGHSLKAMKLMSRLRLKFMIDMPVKWLFEKPTVASLSATIERALKTDSKSGIPPILPAPHGQPLPLSYFQERVWGFCQNDTDNRYCSLMPLRLKGVLNLKAFKQALSELFRRHDIFRTTVEIQDGNAVQSVHPAGTLRLEVSDLTERQMSEEEIERLREDEAMRPFNLQCDWILRMSLVRIKADHHEFMIMVHHLLYDSSFNDVFFRELRILYGAFCRDQSSPLLKPSAQYGDFSIWQKRWLRPETGFFDKQLNYWRQKLADAPAALRLNFERTKPEVQNLDDCTKVIKVGGESLSAIRTFSQTEGVTVFMTLLSAINAVLRIFAEVDDIVVGTYLANRNLLEMEHVIGPQTNLVLLRTEVSACLTFRELVGQVRQMMLDAQSCQDIPHNVLEQSFAAECRLMPEPRVIVMHSSIDESEEHMRMGELEVERIVPPKRSIMPWGLTLQNIETTSELHCILHFNTDLYDPVPACEMFERICLFLQQAVRIPDASIDFLLGDVNGAIQPQCG